MDREPGTDSLGEAAKGLHLGSAPDHQWRHEGGQEADCRHRNLVPKPDKFSYRWFRSGKPIAKATGKTYQLKKADKGKTIKVSITASGSGLQTAVRTSLSTPKVTK